MHLTLNSGFTPPRADIEKSLPRKQRDFFTVPDSALSNPKHEGNCELCRKENPILNC